MRALCLLALSLIPAAPLAAQAMVENALLSGAASAASGSMAKAGAAVAKVLSRADNALSGKAAKESPVAARPSVVTIDSAPIERKPAPPPPPKPSKADFDSIVPGLSRSELIAKVGLPAISILSDQGESLSYDCKEGDAFTIKMSDGKIASIVGR